MMRKFLLLTTILIASVVCHAQTGSGNDFQEMAIDFEELEMYDTGQMKRITSAVITVSSDDPSKEDIVLRAKVATFSYKSDGDAMPETIIFVGNVKVEHPAALITSEKAVWNYAENIFEFTGNPEATSASADFFPTTAKSTMLA